MNSLKLILLFLSVSFASCSVNHKVKIASIGQNNEALLQHLYYLSSDGLQGRKFGSIGSELAQEYIVN